MGAASLGSQIDALRQLVQRVKPFHLAKCGAICRESEGRHILDRVQDALETLEALDRRGYVERDEI